MLKCSWLLLETRVGRGSEARAVLEFPMVPFGEQGGFGWLLLFLAVV